jgi:hypothetical protein
MQPVTDREKLPAGLLLPEEKINRHPFEYEFVRFN